MECKNCGQPLSSVDKFCSDCGAKVINYRLTIKYFFSEFYHSILNIDANKPVKTFIDLFKKPEEVIGGYIDGTRKKYIHAFGYFTIAVTLSSIFYFIFLRFDPSALEVELVLQNNSEAENELGRTLQRSIMDYQSFMFFATIPILALISWIVFLNKKKYNYAEHLIINLYAYSQASIVLILISLLTVWNNHLFSIVSVVTIFIQIFYFFYVLKRLFKLSSGQMVIKTLYFLAIFIPVYIIIFTTIVSIFAASGSFDALIEAEKAKQGVSQIVYGTTNLLA